jgi:hypothetical protein
MYWNNSYVIVFTIYSEVSIVQKITMSPTYILLKSKI